MADRSVLEKRVAQRQLLGRTAAQIRQLQSRANRGALRTARLETFTPNDLTLYSTVLSLDVLPGRWLITGEATFVVAAPASRVSLHLTISATDPTTGLPLAGEDYDFPVRDIDIAASGLVRMPITVTGSCITVVDVASLSSTMEGDSPAGVITINLLARDALANSYTLEQPRLLLSPW